MKLVAVTRVLNESDIVEAFVRHTAHFVDQHLFVDNGSVDGTLGILEKLKQEGLPLSVFQSGSRSFVEAQVNTFLYRTAVSDNAADWVVFLDADEFIDDAWLTQPLRDTIAAFQARHGDGACIRVPLRDYHLTPEDPADPVVPRRIRHCIDSAGEGSSKVIVPAALLARNAVVLAGNHAVQIDQGALCPAHAEPGLAYAHYAVRSPYQWISKALIGWSKVLAAGPETVAAKHGYHYQWLFDSLRGNPAGFFSNPQVMQKALAPAGLTLRPLDYRGGELRHTGPVDHPMRAAKVLMQYLHELASQHGEMLELVNKLHAAVERNEGISPLF